MRTNLAMSFSCVLLAQSTTLVRCFEKVNAVMTAVPLKRIRFPVQRRISSSLIAGAVVKKIRRILLCLHQIIHLLIASCLSSLGYRNLQMLLGSLRVLQIVDDKNHISKAPEPSLSAAASEETQMARSLPADLNERIMAMTGLGEPTLQNNDQGARGGGGSSQVETSLRKKQQEAKQGQAYKQDASRSAGLRGGYKHNPNYGDGVVPSVLELQMLVEQAWDAGYDPEGYDAFQPEGVRGNERWIGRAVPALQWHFGKEFNNLFASNIRRD
jgi:hypothetical protein